MRLATSLPASAIDMVVGFLLPLILPATGGDIAAATALALDRLAEYRPRTARELDLAGEALGYSLKARAMLAQSAGADLPADKVDNALKWACSLSRASHQAQRRLDLLQRAPRALSPDDATAGTPAEEVPASAPAPLQASPPAEVTTAVPASPAASAPAPASCAPASAVAEAEAAYALAAARLEVLQSHYKGAPPPHTKAAQQIQAQQRLVNAARMKVQAARRHAGEAASPLAA
ncbi:MAG: hypothetical protein U1E70_20710 [Acetobacteraceae bacterium]